MNYEISTIPELKAAIVDAINVGVVLDKRDTRSLEAFNDAVDAYVETCRDQGAHIISPDALPSGHDVYDWYQELTAGRAEANLNHQLAEAAMQALDAFLNGPSDEAFTGRDIQTIEAAFKTLAQFSNVLRTRLEG